MAADRRRLTADILVAGAGPAGLALALQAHDHGAVVRVVDRRPEAIRPSRALILHARTLEVLRPLGVTQALLARLEAFGLAGKIGTGLLFPTLPVAVQAYQDRTKDPPDGNQGP